jgi:hypothetical protein
MPCPFLSGKKQLGCAASKKLVNLCIAEIEGKCKNDAKYKGCDQFKAFSKGFIIK